jgi:hypothetical protein
MELLRTVSLRGVYVILLLALASSANASFFDPFSTTTLDPAWQVVEFTGSRVYGYTSPANHYSLSDRAGYLRYMLDPMTHGDGFWNGFQTTYGQHSCCNHDPGVELRREITGEYWELEAQADFYMPYTNGRGLDLNVYFGDGNYGTYLLRFHQGRDVNGYYNGIFLIDGSADPPFYGPHLADSAYFYDLYAPPETSVYLRLQRNGGELTASRSVDGLVWDTAFIYDLGHELDGLNQTLVITGLSWFNAAGSYADWDYVSLTNTPEPGSLWLLALGGVLLAVRRISRRSA